MIQRDGRDNIRSMMDGWRMGRTDVHFELSQFCGPFPEEVSINGGVPLYLYRKLVVYGLKSLLSLRQARRRFYLVRTAAVLGEISGHRARHRAAAVVSVA